MKGSDHDVDDDAHAGTAGGVPDASPPGADAPVRGDDDELDATRLMDDEEWLEHALGDLHSSAWIVPTVEL